MRQTTTTHFSASSLDTCPIEKQGVGLVYLYTFYQSLSGATTTNPVPIYDLNFPWFLHKSIQVDASLI